MSGVLAVAVAYLLGSIPFGLLLGRLGGGIDVRARGSGNIGATNVARSLGLGAGILTLALDLGKGAAGVCLGRILVGSAAGEAASGLAAILGHVFPIYLRFRGGKGVATGCGVFLMLDPVATLGAAGVFALVVAATRRISPGSILASVALPILLAWREGGRMLVAVGLVSTVLIVFRHRANIRNLLAGTEPRLGEGSR